MESLNILYVGNVHYDHSTESSVIRQLKRDGHIVNPVIYPTKAGTDYPTFNKELFKILEKDKYDLMIGTKCMGLKKEDIEKIKIPKISWVFDLFNGYTTWVRSKWYEAQAPGWDSCFGAEGGMVNKYRDMGINYHHLKAGADSVWHKKTTEIGPFEEHRCDVSFLGGIYNELRQSMESRLKTIPNVEYRNFVGYELKGTMIPGVFMEGISQFANVCKISIGCNYRNDIEGYWSKRPYELIASNHFLIQAHVKGMELEGFKNGKNTIFFYDNNWAEMEELIKYYLRPENKEEYDKIKEAGYQLGQSQHMMANRTKVLFNTLKKDKII